VRRAGLVAALVLVASGCGASHTAGIPAALLAQARPIGHGARFIAPARGPIVGECRPALGERYGVHVEVFAENRVVIVPAGIGTRAPRSFSEGRISRARCYGDLVTVEPTGVVLVRAGARATVADLFRAWGQPLSAHRLAGFAAGRGSRVTAFVNGRAARVHPGTLALARHTEIVLEVGPYVPPHTSYTFPPGA
jgi:hypothetical protein